MKRGLVYFIGLLALPSAEAFQCRPMVAVANDSPVVFIGRPELVLSRRDIVVPPSAPMILGAPEAYDEVRFDVMEVLKGALPRKLVLLCPEDVCRIDDPNGPFVIALQSSTVAGPPSILCRWGYLTQPVGWPPAPELAARIERWRAERDEKPQLPEAWRSR